MGVYELVRHVAWWTLRQRYQSYRNKRYDQTHRDSVSSHLSDWFQSTRKCKETREKIGQ